MTASTKRMIKQLLATVLLASLIAGLRAEELFFENVGPDGRQDLALSVEGEAFVGTLTQTADSGNAFGTFAGEKGADGVHRATYAFEVEGAPLTEEILFKVTGDELLMGVGELAEKEPGHMVPKDPAKVEFTKIFKRVPASKTDQASPEGAAVAKALAGPLGKELGLPVVLNAGVVVISGDWALYDGAVSAAEAGASLDAAQKEQLANGRYRGFARREAGGAWKPVRGAFMDENGDFGFADEGEPAPWQLVEAITLPARWSEQ